MSSVSLNPALKPCDADICLWSGIHPCYWRASELGLVSPRPGPERQKAWNTRLGPIKEITLQFSSEWDEYMSLRTWCWMDRNLEIITPLNSFNHFPAGQWLIRLAEGNLNHGNAKTSVAHPMILRVEGLSTTCAKQPWSDWPIYVSMG